MEYRILQLPIENNNKFRGLDLIKTFNLHDYKEVYVGELQTDKQIPKEILEEIYYILNCNHPKDYKTHSLSVSDLVVIDVYNPMFERAIPTYFYCDSMGFKQLPIFNLMKRVLKED